MGRCVPAAEGRPTVARGVVPAAATEDPGRAARGRSRVAARIPRVGLVVVAILAPLPHIPGHVERPEGRRSRRETPHGRCERVPVTLSAVPLPALLPEDLG